MIVDASPMNEFSVKFRIFRLAARKKLKCTMLLLAYTANNVSDLVVKVCVWDPLLSLGSYF